jgi:hypothetical protein
MADNSYGAYNEGPVGEHRFYELQTGKYQNPIIVAEPERAFSAPNDLDYVDAHDDPTYPIERIAGIICKRTGEVIHRFSLSSPAAAEMIIEEDGAELVIEGVRWHLRGLFRKDANRIIGYDAFYGEEKPGEVVIKELADVDFE